MVENIRLKGEIADKNDVVLDVKNDENGDIIIFVVDEFGNPIENGILFKLTEVGITLYRNINPELPIKTDNEGKIVYK